MLDSQPRVTLLHEILDVESPDPISMQLRIAAMIARVVRQHRASVSLIVGRQRCDAASALQVLMAFGAEFNVRRFALLGPQTALRDLALVFECCIVEGRPESIPAQLGYLRDLASAV